MIAIEFECNHCKGKSGFVDVILDKPYIVCDSCEEVEVITDTDIVAHCEV